MYSTQIYLFQQAARVLLLDSSGQYFTARYESMYAKKLTISKGVDNVLLFSFVNQEEKPCIIHGYNLTFRLLDQRGTAILYEAPMVILNGCVGQAKVTIPAADVLEVRAQPASYSITVQAGNLTQAAFTNAMAGARAPVEIVDSVLPYFVPSAELTIPTTELSSQLSFDGASYQNYPNWAGQFANGSPSNLFNYQNPEFFSSHIQTVGSTTTIQMDLVDYTGTIKVQGAQNYQSIWYNVTESRTYYNETRTVYFNVFGHFPLLRLAFNNSVFATPQQPGKPASAYATCVGGQVTDIELFNGGSGYLAPPKVSIIGDGAGAQATAVMAPNVDGITLVSPGSGYTVAPGVVLIGNGAGAAATCTINGLGEVDAVTITNPGFGYVTPPTVQFIGASTTPAAAVTSVNTSGTLLGITVDTPGSGYWPTPIGSVNAVAYPVAPQQQGAAVMITTGYVINLKYR